MTYPPRRESGVKPCGIKQMINQVYRYIVVLALLSAFFLNLIQILYFLLYDKVVVDCERSKPFFGAISCALMHSAAHNMSAFAALFLALLHLAGFAAAMSGSPISLKLCLWGLSGILNMMVKYVFQMAADYGNYE
ncbi:unnamed protein product [Nippostrongylus brasiliensis]|uniref:CASP-like protein n=1 Tax=Nippostrongylus brasiliensis TaxID=27835 RepID=A0A158R037_NIPBR|nr:unnamed protein product [Nippostrongylus brasiliensis]